MILSASRRTDIPCLYSEWFMNRIRAGYVLTRNPMNPSQLSRITLSPEVIDCIVFWTKDPLPLIPHLGELDERGFRYYFQFTLTPYGNEIEANLRPKSDIISSFIDLSKRIGRERVVWRYDPIILNDTLDTAYNMNRFSEMCVTLAPYTDMIVISFIDLYAKLKTPLIRPLTDSEIAELSGFIAETAAKYGIRAVSCCESGLSQYGIAPSSCIDKTRIERIIACPLNLSADKNQRASCGCYESIDIGAYNTCTNGCIYCYANNKLTTVARRFSEHDPLGELLWGKPADGEKIIQRKCFSNKQV